VSAAIIMASEIGGNAAGSAENEDDLTALEKFGNKFYNGVCGVLCVSAHLFCKLQLFFVHRRRPPSFRRPDWFSCLFFI
jgi:hypothetical protein